MEKNTYGQSIMRTGSCNNRNKSIDIAKGLLILCVVIGHGTQNQSLSDFMYRFHMPLFLILSGCFLKVSAKYCYITHELRLHQNDRCKRFTPV